MSFVLGRRQASLVPHFHGFCGDLVAADPVHPGLYRLPVSPTSAWYSVITPLYARFFWPDLPTRVRNSVKLLDFSAVLHNDGHDSLVICQADHLDLYGTDTKGELRMTSFGSLYVLNELESLISSKRCMTNADCTAMPPDCGSSCIAVTGRCLVPVIAPVCGIIVPYLMPGSTVNNASFLCREPSTSAVMTTESRREFIEKYKSSLFSHLAVDSLVT